MLPSKGQLSEQCGQEVARGYELHCKRRSRPVRMSLRAEGHFQEGNTGY